MDETASHQECSTARLFTMYLSVSSTYSVMRAVYVSAIYLT